VRPRWPAVTRIRQSAHAPMNQRPSFSDPLTLAVPRHVAIVMDGNGRWARSRHLPRLAGHKQGVDALRRAVKACIDRGV
jgi:undecaprenyl diphosphate synthase